MTGALETQVKELIVANMQNQRFKPGSFEDILNPHSAFQPVNASDWERYAMDLGAALAMAVALIARHLDEAVSPPV